MVFVAFFFSLSLSLYQLIDLPRYPHIYIYIFIIYPWYILLTTCYYMLLLYLPLDGWGFVELRVSVASEEELRLALVFRPEVYRISRR